MERAKKNRHYRIGLKARQSRLEVLGCHTSIQDASDRLGFSHHGAMIKGSRPVPVGSTFDQANYSPARGLIKELSFAFKDRDGNYGTRPVQFTFGLPAFEGPVERLRAILL